MNTKKKGAIVLIVLTPMSDIASRIITIIMFGLQACDIYTIPIVDGAAVGREW